jgi:hypothetical protein
MGTENASGESTPITPGDEDENTAASVTVARVQARNSDTGLWASVSLLSGPGALGQINAAAVGIQFANPIPTYPDPDHAFASVAEAVGEVLPAFYLANPVDQGEPNPSGNRWHVTDATTQANTFAAATSVASVDTKMLPALATALLDPVRGTATSTATQLGSLATPRGFTLENIDASNYLYWGKTDAVTPANGYRIEPGYGYDFDVPNANHVWLVAATTADYQIGGTS